MEERDKQTSRSYKTLEEVEAEWDAKKQREKANLKGDQPVFWLTYYFLRDVYYAVFYRFHPGYALRKIYWFFHRGAKGWASPDCWSLSAYLSRVIKESVEHLRGQKLEVPGYFLPEGKESDPQAERIAERDWNAILDEIIWTFDMAKQVDNGDVHMYVESWSEEENLKLEKTLNDMAVKKGYEPYKYMTKKEYERMRHGMALLLEHYWGLWY